MSSKSSPTGSTPHHVKPARHQSSSNTPGIQQQQQQQQQYQDESTPDESAALLPPPQTFDILPSLHALLARLLSAPTKAGGVGGEPTSGDPNTQPLSGGRGGETVEGGSTDALAIGSLDPKELITEASAIKIRIQKARAAVDGLPDIDRTVDEQEGEIAELERRIERLKEVIGDFGQRSTKAIGGDDMNR